MCNQSTQTLCTAYIHDSLHWRATMNSFRLITVKKHIAYLHTFVPALSATTFRLGRTHCVLVEPAERIAKTAQYHNYVSFL